MQDPTSQADAERLGVVGTQATYVYALFCNKLTQRSDNSRHLLPQIEASHASDLTWPPGFQEPAGTDWIKKARLRQIRDRLRVI